MSFTKIADPHLMRCGELNWKKHVTKVTKASKVFNSFSGVIDCRRQNPTSKVDPRTEKSKLFKMAVDP